MTPVGKGDPAAHLRPTTDRVRESLFNLLAHGGFGDPVEGAKVLDLFAGTGALGLEALSRGAERVTFVESGRKGGALLAANIALLGAQAEARVIRRDATRLGPGTPHDLVFLDPPYGTGLGERALLAAMAGGWVDEDALVVWEDDRRHNAPEGFRAVDARDFGETRVTFLRMGA